MDEKTMKQNEEVQIDLKRLVDALLRKAWALVLAAVLGASIALVGTALFITPQYQSSAMFYVNNGSLSIGNASLSLSAGDISASRGLVDTYIVILKTRETLNDVIDYAGVDMTYDQLDSMISAAAVDDTEIFRVTITHPDPETAQKLADAVSHIFPKRIDSIIESTSAQVVDSAIVPSKPSSPSYTKNTMLGFVIGLVLVAVVVVIRELLDISIRVEEDITRVCAHPVLATVPDMTAPSKGGRYYKYGKYGYGNTKKTAGAAPDVPVLIGGGISFAASEAYKLLRTKLQYSFADEKTSHVIGISSALTGEGKSLTSVNLAYSLAQLDKKVLLIDCDMRRPSIATKLSISRYPGLSGYLSGQNELEEIIHHHVKEEESTFHVIASGQNPPNPIELLSSPRMAKLLTKLRETYDYVILDLPPISEVSDALAIAKETDGMLLVVRQHHCDRNALFAAIRQIDFVDGRVLGVVYNCANEEGKGYGYYKKYYRRYYSRYGYRYEGTYMAAGKAAKAAKVNTNAETAEKEEK